jgi:hypothetical protein
MRTVFEDQVAAQAKGLAAAAEVASRWTWEHAAEKVRRRLLELQ